MFLKSRFNWVSFVALFFLINIAFVAVVFVRYLNIYFGMSHNPEFEAYFDRHGPNLLVTFFNLCLGAIGTLQLHRKKKNSLDILSLWLFLDIVASIYFRELLLAEDWFALGIMWVIGYAVVGKTRAMVNSGKLT